MVDKAASTIRSLTPAASVAPIAVLGLICKSKCKPLWQNNTEVGAFSSPVKPTNWLASNKLVRVPSANLTANLPF